MTTKPEKTDDNIDALEALESEEKEYLKVSSTILLETKRKLLTHCLHSRMQKLIES